MIFQHGFLASILLVSATQVPASPFLQARRGVTQNWLSRSATSSPNDTLNWAGAVWSQENGNFTAITGTFTVPNASGDTGATVDIWVGIDGYICKNALLNTGVSVSVGQDGPVAAAWYQWYPGNNYLFESLPIHAGDVVKATVIALNATAGIAFIKNLSTGSGAQEYLTSSHGLCGQNVEWIVQDYTVGGSYVPFADFGTVTFTDAIAARATGGPLSSSGATALDMNQNGTLLASTSINGDNVTITYK